MRFETFASLILIVGRFLESEFPLSFVAVLFGLLLAVIECNVQFHERKNVKKT